MASVNRAAEAIMAALSVQSASGAAVASGREALSSEFAATPPTTATFVAPISPAACSRSLHERAHDRPLITRRQVRATALQLVRLQFLDRVQQRRLETGEREVEPRYARDGKVVRTRVAFTCERGRSRHRRDSRAREAALPCRTPHRQHRRESFRGREVACRDPARRAATCGRRSRAGRETAARAASGSR